MAIVTIIITGTIEIPDDIEQRKNAYGGIQLDGTESIPSIEECAEWEMSNTSPEELIDAMKSDPEISYVIGKVHG